MGIKVLAGEGGRCACYIIPGTWGLIYLRVSGASVERAARYLALLIRDAARQEHRK